MAIGNVGLAARIERQGSLTSKPTSFLGEYFYLGMALVMSSLVVWGFSRTVNANLFHANPPRPLLLWAHGAAFSSWMIFFIVQSSLVRAHKVSVHRLLGWFGAGLASGMTLLGFTIAIVMARFDTFVLHQKGADAFLSIPFNDMIVFGTCIALAIYWRKKAEYHRRLIFIATCELMDAALGRFDYLFNHNLFYPGLDLLIVAGMMRDWLVDGRISKVYIYALPVMVALQSLSIYAWRINPAWWQGVTRAILGL